MGCDPAATPEAVAAEQDLAPGPKDIDVQASILAASSGFVALTASSQQSGYVAANAADGSYATRWQAQGRGAFITGDMGSSQSISAIQIAWYRGAYRRYSFSIQVGDSPNALRTVFSGTSSGTTSQLERYDFPAVTARCIRVVGNGNTENRWNSITEMQAAGAAAAPVAVSVTPGTASVTTSGTQQFTASVTNGAGAGVTWKVLEGTSGGTVDGNGRYTAPGAAGTYRVVATAVADTSKSSTATVTVTAAAQVVAVAVSPRTTSVMAGGSVAFSATVTGTANTSVTWTVQEGAAGGAVSSTGVYTAPSAPGTYHVVATSSADPSRTDVATVTVTAPAVSLAVSPRTASAVAGGTVAFSATVSGSSNTAVTWSVQEGATGGSVSGAGVYTAPATPGTYHVVARSSADSSKTDTATVTVTAAPVTVGVSVSPTTATLTTGGTSTFTATVTGSSDTRVTWSVQEGSAGGTITAGGAYTAPATAGTYHVIATSVADGTKKASATVTVTAPSGGGGGTTTCATEPIRSTGTVRYYCDCQAGADGQCVAGNDANAGTSPSAPKRSFAAALADFNSMTGGSTIAFCKGGSWSIGSNYNTLANTRCSASATCDWRDYTPSWATGDEARPKLAFTSTSYGNGFAFNNSGAGFRLFNLWLYGPGTSEGFFFYNQVNDVDVCNVRIERWAGGVNLASGNSTKSRITFRDNQFIDNTDQGWLGAANDLTLSGNYFENNGSRATFNHSLYVNNADLNGTHVETSNIVLRNNTIRFRSGYACAGTVFVVHGRHAGVTVEGNDIDVSNISATTGCYGMSFKTGYSYSFAGAEYIKNGVFRGNKVKGAGGNLLVGNSCDGCLIENNVLIGGSTSGTGIRIEQSDTGDGDSPNRAVVIRNNTISLGATSEWPSGIRIDAVEGGGHVIASNVAQAQSGGCFYAPTSGLATMDNNLCSGFGSWANDGSLASWRSASGRDLASQQASPAFASSTDFTPQSGSPLVGNAHPTQHATVDLNGKARDAAPDIGALER